MFIATLIAADTLLQGDISMACDRLAEKGCEPGGVTWLEKGKAADLGFRHGLEMAHAAFHSGMPGVDIVVQPESGRAKRLFVADMDSTIITVECIDELADYAGLKPQVAEITERAMRGELDFKEALDERVNLINGLTENTLMQCYNERVQKSPGAETLIRTMRDHAVHCVLVSGGFTHFAERVAAETGFNEAIANRLEVKRGKLTGRVLRPIVDGGAKARSLIEKRVELGLDKDDVMAVGDGANDAEMIEIAGLGVAYRAKPKLRAIADARIDHGDLTALLYAQGYRRKDWIIPG